MKLLYLTRKFPPAVGGAERVNAELAGALARQVDVRFIAEDCRTLPRIARLHARALWRELRRRGHATHIFVGDGLLAPLGLALGRLHRAKVTVWAHGLDVAYPSPIYQRAIVPALRRADRVIAVSEATRALLLERGVRASRIRVLPHGRERLGAGLTRDAARFALGIDGKVILFVGRLVPRKGVAEFIAEVLPRVPDARFVVIGEGHVVAGRRVTALGHTDERTKDLWLRAADCLVMPNVRRVGDPEGFGLVAIEAAARGLPTVGYAVDSLPEAISDGVSGRLVAAGDAAAMAAAVSEFLGLSDDERAAWSASCRKWAAHWPDWATAARGISGAMV